MKPEDIEKDRAIIAAATPWPWEALDPDLDHDGLGHVARIMIRGPMGRREASDADLRLAAAARTRWPAALDDIEASIRAIASAEDDAKHELEQADRGRPPDEYAQGYHAGLLVALKILRGEP